VIVDAQIHEPVVSGDWSDADETTRRRVLTEVLVDTLDAVGVDAALLFPLRQFDWAQETAAKHPSRFAYVPHADGSESEEVEALGRSGLPAGLRMILGSPRTGEEVARFRAGAYEALLRALQMQGLPLFLMATWHSDLVDEIAERHRDLTIVLDHLGLPQPPTQERDEPPFRNADRVLALSRHPNVAIKLSGAPALSSEPFPFADLGPHLRRYADAFGAERLLWGSDYSRFDGRIGFFRQPLIPDAFDRKHTYAEALTWVVVSDVLTASEKELVLGGSARRLLGWPPG
jgi:L-fuconolactonase